MTLSPKHVPQGHRHELIQQYIKKHYALALQVHIAASLLQQYAVVCKLSDATTWKSKLGWNALQICLVNAVWLCIWYFF
jgi:hypothetical protein